MFIALRGLFFCACAGVLVLSLLPAAYIPNEFNFWDKAQHALGFAGLAVLGHCAYARQTKKVLWGLIAFGALIEVLQAQTTWRQGDPLDWLADCLGVLVVSLLGWRYPLMGKKG